MSKEKFEIIFKVVFLIILLMFASFILTACVVKLFCNAFGFEFSWLIAAAVWTIAVWVKTLIMPNKKD